ncbi:MAG: hypothetical protein QOI72_1295 [Solirubrobacterales bacterium]|jgi:uncharacterized Ntn-hydrolase superfamily protein|nr:hypothetical protein [Solirubrobacterales bacterium]
MTLSLIARCPRTGQLGITVSTSDIAVGARVAFAAAGVGAVLTQHRTDPRLGPRGLDLLRSGCDAAETLDALVASTPQRAWRQLAVVDARGRTASFSGGHVVPHFAELHGSGCVALGNMLAGDDVGPAMIDAFGGEREPLAERLLRALEGGLRAGGEEHPLRSAALLVVADQPFALVDLRVDLHDQPVAQLRDLWQSYRPRVDEFVARALEPDTVGVAVEQR